MGNLGLYRGHEAREPARVEKPGRHRLERMALMPVMEAIKTVIDVARKLGNLELNKMVLDLQSQILELLQQNKTLEEDCESLRGSS